MRMKNVKENQKKKERRKDGNEECEREAENENEGDRGRVVRRQKKGKDEENKTNMWTKEEEREGILQKVK